MLVLVGIENAPGVAPKPEPVRVNVATGNIPVILTEGVLGVVVSVNPVPHC